MVVKLLAAVLRVYSLVFHLTLSVFLIGLSCIAYRANQELNSWVPLPFDDEYVLRDTLILGVIGMLCTLLALTRWFKYVFVCWTIVVFYLMLKSFFWGSYPMRAPQQIRGAEWLTFGAVGAFFGALWGARLRRRMALL